MAVSFSAGLVLPLLHEFSFLQRGGGRDRLAALQVTLVPEAQPSQQLLTVTAWIPLHLLMP